MFWESDPSLREADQLRRLDDLARGELAISDAVKLIREILRSPGDTDVARVYTALKDYTWQCLAQAAGSDDRRRWFDLLRHASVLMRRRGDTDLSSRLVGFSELIAQSIRFSDLQPIAAILQRKHVSAILHLLTSRGGSLKRSVIGSELKIEDANLSRILTIVCAHNLVRRDSIGKEAIFSLTATGREAAGAAASIAGGEAECFPYPYARWNAKGTKVVSNEMFENLCGGFELPRGDRDDISVWQSALESRAIEKRSDLVGAWELKFANDRWLRLFSKSTNGETVVTIEEITGRKTSEEALLSGLSRLKDTRNALTEDVAKLHVRVDSYQKAIGDARTRLLMFADMANSSLNRAIELCQMHADTAIDELSETDGWLRSIRVALRDFLPLPFPDASKTNEDALFGAPTRIETDFWLKDIVSAINRLPEHDVHVQLGGMQPVEGSADVFKATVGQLLLTHYEGLNPSKLEATVDRNNLVLRLGLKAAANHTGLVPSHYSFLEEFWSGSKHGVELDLSYCMLLVREHGGNFIVTVDPTHHSAEVRVAFPLGPNQPNSNPYVPGRNYFSRIGK